MEAISETNSVAVVFKFYLNCLTIVKRTKANMLTEFQPFAIGG